MRFADAAWWEMVAGTVGALHVENGYPVTAHTAGTLLYQARELGWNDEQLRAWLNSQPHPVPIPVPPPPAPTPQPPPSEPCAGLTERELVACIRDRINPPHTAEGAFEITKRVAWALRGDGAGLLLKASGENIVTWHGQSFAAARICYPDGHIIKILSDVPTTNGPSWQDNGFVSPDLYVAAINPA